MTKLNLEEFKDNFNLFRGKLRAFTKLLNSLHLNILATFSEIILCENVLCSNDESFEEYYVVLSYIYLDLRSFYKYKKNEIQKFDDFIMRKYNEIDIHETITKIISNLSKRLQISALFWEENMIVNDLINYILKISNTSQNDFIKNTIERERRRKKVDDIKKTILSICENTLNIFSNLFGASKYNEPKFLLFLENVTLN